MLIYTLDFNIIWKLAKLPRHSLLRVLAKISSSFTVDTHIWFNFKLSQERDREVIIDKLNKCIKEWKYTVKMHENYLFLSSSSLFSFSVALLCSADAILGLRDLGKGDKEVLLLLCLRCRLGVGDRFLRLYDGERLLRRREELERLLRLLYKIQL